MSFSLANIKCKKPNKVNNITTNKNIRTLYAYVNNLDIITDNIKIGLKAYLDFRVNLRNNTYLTVDNLEDMVVELLESCCNKSYLHIGIKDVSIEENEILYQIKKAIYYGATKHIYSPYDTVQAKEVYFGNNLRKDILPPKRVTVSFNKKDTLNYFAELKV